MVRSKRNNNPGNLRHSAGNKILSPYVGEIRPTTDSNFRTFLDESLGWRALFLQLQAYLKRGIDTPRKIINTYAPPNENQTGTYLNYLLDQTKFNPDQVLYNTKSDLFPIALAIGKYEGDRTIDIDKANTGFNIIPSSKAIAYLDQLKKKTDNSPSPVNSNSFITDTKFFIIGTIFLLLVYGEPIIDKLSRAKTRN